MRLIDFVSPLEMVMELAEDPDKEQKLVYLEDPAIRPYVEEFARVWGWESDQARQALAAMVCIDNVLKRKELPNAQPG